MREIVLRGYAEAERSSLIYSVISSVIFFGLAVVALAILLIRRLFHRAFHTPS